MYGQDINRKQNNIVSLFYSLEQESSWMGWIRKLCLSSLKLSFMGPTTDVCVYLSFPIVAWSSLSCKKRNGESQYNACLNHS